MSQEMRERWGVGRQPAMKFRNIKVLKGVIYGEVRVGHSKIGSEVWVYVKISGFLHPEALAPLEKLLADTATEHVRFALDGKETQ
jgi:hypothetical protein